MKRTRWMGMQRNKVRQRYKNDPEFREMKKKAARLYYENNKEKISEKKKAYFKTEKGKLSLRKSMKKYYAKNRDRIIKQTRTYYENNKEKILKREARYREKKRAELRELGRDTPGVVCSVVETPRDSTEMY